MKRQSRAITVDAEYTQFDPIFRIAYRVRSERFTIYHVRRRMKQSTWRPHLRENLAYLVKDIKR